MKKTIIYLSEFGEMGGAENSLIRLIKGMKDYYNVILISPRGELSTLSISEGAKYYEFDIPTIRLSGFFINRNKIFSFINLLSSLDGSNVIFHANTFRTRVYLGLLKFFLKGKLIGHIRDYNCSVMNSFLVLCLDETIVISDFVKDSLKKFVPDKRVSLVYNGVENLSQYHSNGYFDDEKGRCKYNKKVVLLGRIEEWKNQHRFIECANLLSKTRNDIDFYIIGSPMKKEHVDYYNQMCELAKTVDSVFIYKYTEKPFDVIKEADLLVCPSINEPFGRVVIEALSLKTMIIGSNNGGVKEILSGFDSEMMFDPLNVYEMANKINKYIDISNDNEVVDDGFEFYIENFSIDKNIQLIKSLYEQ